MKSTESEAGITSIPLVDLSMATIGIFVLNYDGRHLLERCFTSVMAAAGSDANVYLVDNASIDNSVEYVKQYFPNVKIINFHRNLGFAEAYNRAVEQTQEDVLVFLNNDVEVERQWLCELVRPLTATHNDVGITGSKLLLFSDRKRVNSAGGSLLPIGGGIDLGYLKLDNAVTDQARYVGCVCGASMALKRSVFQELNGFDSDFFAYFEDTDFCWRAWLTGHKVMLIPKSRVYHRLSASWGSYLSPERAYLGQRNRLQSLVKNLETENVIVGLWLYCIFFIIRTTRYLRFRNSKSVVAMLQGILWTLHNVQSLRNKRHQVQTCRVITDNFLFRKGLMMGHLEAFREFVRIGSDRRKHSSTLPVPIIGPLDADNSAF